MILVTDQNLVFTVGTATLNAKGLADAYGKSVGSAITHIKTAGGTVITSTNVDANGVVTTRAYNMSANAVFAGTLGCMVYLVLK